MSPGKQHNSGNSAIHHTTHLKFPPLRKVYIVIWLNTDVSEELAFSISTLEVKTEAALSSETSIYMTKLRRKVDHNQLNSFQTILGFCSKQLGRPTAREGFEVLTALNMRMFFWDMAPCELVGRSQRFACTHLRDASSKHP